MKQKKLRPTIVNKFTFNAPIGRFFEYVENYYGDNGDDQCQPSESVAPEVGFSIIK